MHKYSLSINMKKYLVLFLLLLLQILTVILVDDSGYTYYESHYKSISHDINYGISLMLELNALIAICTIANILINWIRKTILIYLVYFLGYVVFVLYCIRDYTGSFSHPLQATLMLISGFIGIFIPLLFSHLIIQLLKRRYPESSFIKTLPFS